MILHHELKVINDMNDSKSWSHEFRWYEQLKVVDNMSYSRLLAQGSARYEQLKFVDDMIYSRSREHKLLDCMNNSRVWMIWMILGHETMALKCYE